MVPSPRTTLEDMVRANARFSSAVRARDNYQCRFERWVDGQWVECGARSALFAAHIYGRNWCGDAKFDPIVGITGCLADHDRYDGRRYDSVIVRVPPEREALAYALITAAVTTFHIPRRLPPERGP